MRKLGKRSDKGTDENGSPALMGDFFGAIGINCKKE